MKTLTVREMKRLKRTKGEMFLARRERRHWLRRWACRLAGGLVLVATGTCMMKGPGDPDWENGGSDPEPVLHPLEASARSVEFVSRRPVA